MPPSDVLKRAVAAAADRRPPSGRAGRAPGSDRAHPRRRAAGRASVASPSRVRDDRRAARAPAQCRARRFAGRQGCASTRSSDSSMSRGTSVSSAISKPGSMSASSGNSRSSDRQNASIVLMAISPRRSRRSSQRARSSSDRAAGGAQLANDALAHLGRRLPRERDRQDVGRIDARLEQIDVARDEHRRLPGAGRCLEHDVVARVDGERRARSASRRAAPAGDGAAGRRRVGDVGSSASHRTARAATTVGDRRVTHRRRSPFGRRAG